MVKYILNSSCEVRLSNAHDRFVKFSGDATFDGGHINIPLDLSTEEQYQMMSETINDLVNHDYEYGEEMYWNEEEGEEEYEYFIYLWWEYTEDCSILDISSYPYKLLTKISIDNSDINFYENGLDLYINADINGDGMLSYKEQNYHEKYGNMLTRLINLQKDGCTFSSVQPQ